LHLEVDGYRHSGLMELMFLQREGLTDCHLRGIRGGSVCSVNIYSDTWWMNADRLW